MHSLRITISNGTAALENRYNGQVWNLSRKRQPITFKNLRDEHSKKKKKKDEKEFSIKNEN